MDTNRDNAPRFNSWDDIKDFLKETIKDKDSLATETIAHMAKNAKRWLIAFLVTLAAFVGTNVFWIYQFTSYEYVYQDGEGQNNFNKNVDGDISNVTDNQEQEER